MVTLYLSAWSNKLDRQIFRVKGFDRKQVKYLFTRSRDRFYSTPWGDIWVADEST